MADTAPIAETAPAEQVKNDAPAATTPTVTQAELDEIRRRADQAEMRARQLENEKQEREKREDEARRKKLEEENEYKTLYEREQAQREELQRQLEQDQAKQEVSRTESSILSGYSQDVRDAASDLGIYLGDSTEDSQATFKKRLDSIKERLGGPAPKVSGNNPAPQQVTTGKDRSALVERARVDKKAAYEVIGSLSAIQEMRKAAGLNE